MSSYLLTFLKIIVLEKVLNLGLNYILVCTLLLILHSLTKPLRNIKQIQFTPQQITYFIPKHIFL